MAFQEILVPSVQELLGWYVLARSKGHVTAPYDNVVHRTLGFEDFTDRVRYETPLTAFKAAHPWLPADLREAFTTTEGRCRVFQAGLRPPIEAPAELLVASWDAAVKLTTLADAFGLAERHGFRVKTILLPFGKWPSDLDKKVLWAATVDETGPYSDCIELLDEFGQVQAKVKVTYQEESVGSL